MTLVPFNDRDGWIWLDGTFVPWRDATIHVLTHGLHYASSVFEGERAYNRKIFKSQEHTQRLMRSAEILGMKIPFSAEQLETAKQEVLKRNNLIDAYIRPFAWRGSEQMGVSAPLSRTRVAIAAWVWPSYFSPELLEKGISLQTSHWRKPDPRTAPTLSKAACVYTLGTMAKHAAEEAGFNDALMLDYRGRVAEATGANLFLVKNGKILTPDPDCFLNGITRQTVIELAQNMGYSVDVAIVMPEDLKDAQEVFVTGTAAEVTAVGRIDDMTYNVGPITRKIRDAYAALVRS